MVILSIYYSACKAYNIALQNAISDGVKYPEQFNEIIDIHKMIKLLEKYNK